MTAYKAFENVHVNFKCVCGGSWTAGPGAEAGFMDGTASTFFASLVNRNNGARCYRAGRSAFMNWLSIDITNEVVGATLKAELFTLVLWITCWNVFCAALPWCWVGGFFTVWTTRKCRAVYRLCEGSKNGLESDYLWRVKTDVMVRKDAR